MINTFFSTSKEQAFSISGRTECMDGPTSSRRRTASCFCNIVEAIQKINYTSRSNQIQKNKRKDNNILNGVSPGNE